MERKRLKRKLKPPKKPKNPELKKRKRLRLKKPAPKQRKRLKIKKPKKKPSLQELEKFDINKVKGKKITGYAAKTNLICNVCKKNKPLNWYVKACADVYCTGSYYDPKKQRKPLIRTIKGIGKRKDLICDTCNNKKPYGWTSYRCSQSNCSGSYIEIKDKKSRRKLKRRKT